MKKKVLPCLFILFLAMGSWAQELKPLTLNPPDLTRGSSVMKSLMLRSSVREFSSEKLTLQDLSDLLWAANGINRPDKGLRTAPSAMNSQDIDIYVFTEEGVYLYDAKTRQLVPVAPGDQRTLTGTQAYAATAPIGLVLVSDLSRFRSGERDKRIIWAALDAGTVSQNISLFCASAGLVTVPRGSVDTEKVTSLLKLTESQIILLHHPVGYAKKQ